MPPMTDRSTDWTPRLRQVLPPPIARMFVIYHKYEVSR